MRTGLGQSQSVNLLQSRKTIRSFDELVPGAETPTGLIGRGIAQRPQVMVVRLGARRHHNKGVVETERIHPTQVPLLITATRLGQDNRRIVVREAFENRGQRAVPVYSG